MLFRPDESTTVRQLIFELRNGPGLPSRYVDKEDDRWTVVNASERLLLSSGQRMRSLLAGPTTSGSTSRSSTVGAKALIISGVVLEIKVMSGKSKNRPRTTFIQR